MTNREIDIVLRDPKMMAALQRFVDDCQRHNIAARVYFYEYAKSDRVAITMAAPIGFLFNLTKELEWWSSRKPHAVDNLLSQGRAVFNGGLYSVGDLQQRRRDQEQHKADISGGGPHTIVPKGRKL